MNDPIEPDEDEDPTRICTKCEERPRWSRHGCCRLCVECAGKNVAWCIRVRKSEEAPKSKVPSRCDALCRQRYDTLRRLGATSKQARAWRTWSACF